jgi:hypothetical protein
MSRDRAKTVIRKAPIVMNSAKIVNEQYESREISYEEAVMKMILFANGGNFKDFWLDIDDLLQKQYKTENWFWLIRKLKDTINEW